MSGPRAARGFAALEARCMEFVSSLQGPSVLVTHGDYIPHVAFNRFGTWAGRHVKNARRAGRCVSFEKW